jgi:polar amino acid transport system substrate-binding protein
MSLPARSPARFSSTRSGVVAVVGAALAALAACAPADDTSTTTPQASGSASATAGACAKDQLKVRTPGKLVIGTDKPAYEPWFKNDDPSNGQGFESAVAYAVADELGFAKGDVTWTVASFNSVIAPGPKAFDFDINQVSITPERAKNIDFSSGYYDVAQAVVSAKGSSIAGAKSIADLKGAKLGAQVGTTSFRTITDVIRPTDKPAVFDKNDDAKLALDNGQIDGLVVDLPTALYLAAAEIKDGVVVGQFENGEGTPEQFGLVLDKGSPLTACVSKAVDALRTNGTLDRLEQQWLTESAGAPVLK